jgi:hypothetical protein
LQALEIREPRDILKRPQCFERSIQIRI